MEVTVAIECPHSEIGFHAVEVDDMVIVNFKDLLESDCIGMQQSVVQIMDGILRYRARWRCPPVLTGIVFAQDCKEWQVLHDEALGKYDLSRLMDAQKGVPLSNCKCPGCQYEVLASLARV